MREKNGSPDNPGLELKYCERCGGLWLRPVGGGQIYCVACNRAMAELPPRSGETQKQDSRPGSRGKMNGAGSGVGLRPERTETEVWHD